MLECAALGGLASYVDYSDLCKGVNEQNIVVKEYVKRLKERDELIVSEAEDVLFGRVPQTAE